ncbi:hypothetical protein N7510_004809 [Penicillium lagena]|uniref:uncharacterized protein n=1 Tax=Penicillium lagena TaxID=94218 RepID=UPI0025405EA0|nr:uncharacterized protein N7510_004809 [Penicillium lagena]KAJ5620825.1 hypothetical protein N7510_004809 [Penicillium lagena]
MRSPGNVRLAMALCGITSPAKRPCRSSPDVFKTDHNDLLITVPVQLGRKSEQQMDIPIPSSEV